MSKNIVVFSGNTCRKDLEEKYYPLAYETGKLLAQNGFVTVTGGGPGLMNQTSQGASEAGGRTIGVCLNIEGIIHSQFLNESSMFDDLRPRQAKSVGYADGFIALPGGVGTIYEALEVMTLKRKGEIELKKPLILLSDYYDKFEEFMNQVFMDGFLDDVDHRLYTRCATPSDAIKKLQELMV